MKPLCFFKLISELDVSNSLRQRGGGRNNFVMFSGMPGFRKEKKKPRGGKVVEIHNKVVGGGIVP